MTTAPCFTVSARCGESDRTETRRSPASAMLLADRWATQGCDHIRVCDPSGIGRNREAFRATLPLVRKMEARVLLH